MALLLPGGAWFAAELGIPGPVYAADISWGNVAGGTFSVASNWQGGSVPGSGDVAHFGLTTNPVFPRVYTVDFSADTTNQAVKIEDDLVAFDLNGKRYTTSLQFGNEIGNIAGRAARLTLTGGTMTCGGFDDAVMAIGAVANAAGALTISTGGHLEGSNPVFVDVGRLGFGTLTVQNGGEIDSAEATYIGSDAAATGNATVTGTGSSIQISQLVVGYRGSGTLSITSGGFVRCDGISNLQGAAGELGFLIGSTGMVTVDGAGSQWMNFGQTLVGDEGSGTLNITNGGEVDSFNFDVFIAKDGSSAGSVTVDGANSKWAISNNLVVGDNANATMSITGGGRVQDIDGSIARFGGSTNSTVTLGGAGSTWANSGNMNVGGSSLSAGGTATVIVQSGAMLSVAKLLTVWSHGVVQWQGGAISAGSVDLRGGGRMNLSAGGDKVLRTAAIAIDAPAGSQLDLADNAVILDYTGASPIASVQNQIHSGYANGAWTGNGMTSSAAAGTAASPHKTALGYGEAAALGLTTFAGQNIDATTVLVRYTYFGDANLDGRVDTLDFNALAANFGGSAKVWTHADFNYDGVVDTLDFNNLAANFGQQLPSDSQGVGGLVPEPGSAWLLGSGALAVLYRSRRLRRRRTNPQAEAAANASDEGSGTIAPTPPDASPGRD